MPPRDELSKQSEPLCMLTGYLVNFAIRRRKRRVDGKGSILLFCRMDDGNFWCAFATLFIVLATSAVVDTEATRTMLVMGL